MRIVLLLNFPTLYQWALNSYIYRLIDAYPRASIIEWKNRNKIDAWDFDSNDVIILIGNFRDYSGPSGTEDSALISFLASFPGKRIWHLYGDLDHKVDHLLFGIKTDIKNINCNLHLNRSREIMEMFSALIWSYEMDFKLKELPYYPRTLKPKVYSLDVNLRFELLLRAQSQLRDQFKRRIEWQHCIETEFMNFLRRIKTKKIDYDVAIIGRNYASREFALKEIRKLGLKIFNGLDEGKSSSESYLRKITSRVGSIIRFDEQKTKYLSFRLYFAEQQIAYLRASAAYVDTGYYGYFVRKYIEAAYAGCALFGNLNCGLKDLGFQNGINFLEIENTENGFAQKKNEIQDHRLHRRLSGNLQELIQESHSSSVRAKQILNSLSKEQIQGVNRFKQGKYVYLPN